MKFETHDLLNDEYKFDLIKLRMHQKVKYNVIFSLFLKYSVTSYKFVHIVFILISSMGLLILSNEFIPIEKQIYFSKYLREITIFSFVDKVKMSHSNYLIICGIIFIIHIYRLIFMFNLSYKTKIIDPFNPVKKQKSIIIRILNHLTYILFSFIIEFLSFVIYIEIFPDKFIIKKDSKINQSIQIIFLILNSIMIISYNANNHFLISLTNRPLSERDYPIKFKFSPLKIIILTIFQNFILIHPLQGYLNKKIHKILSIVFFIVIAAFLLLAYFIQINSYNLNNLINSLVSFIGEFCFVSIIIETIIYALDIRYRTNKELICFIFVKLLFSSCLHFCLDKMHYRLMLKMIKKKIFNNPYNNQFDKEMNDSILFIREMYENKNKKFLSKINRLFIEHKRNCSNNNCACKLINLKFSNGTKIANVRDVFKKLNYFIESILIHFNYQNDYFLSLLLSEHLLIYKDNPLMAYSILQTLFHSNYETLTKNQLIIIYECMTKYIYAYIKKKSKKINIDKQNGFKQNLLKLNKEEELSQYFYLAIKIKNVIKFMIKYSKEFLTILRQKDRYESSTIVKLDEIFNEIKYISSPYLTTTILNGILKFLSLENNYTLFIEKHIQELEEYNKNLTYEFLYKIFLFADFFWNGKIPEKLLNVFYVFNVEHLIYSPEINAQIYQILEAKYTEFFNNSRAVYFVLLKYSKGIKISYLSEILSRLLNYKQTELINNDLGILLLREMVLPHENMIKKKYFLEQNNIIKGKHKYIFDKNGYMYDMKMNSTFQIGLNKNILMISSIEIDKGKNTMKFYANKNLKIISVNKTFEERLSISLALIKEFNLELKDLFGITLEDMNDNYKKEMKKIKNIKEFQILDTREYILKNLFKKKSMNNNYHIISKYIINDKDDEFFEKDNEREKILKVNNDNGKNKMKIEKKLDNLFSNIIIDTIRFSPTFYIINNINFQNNLKAIFEKINSYEQDKLEKKNIFNDFMRLNENITENLFNQNYFINLKIKPRFIYDTLFFLCQIEIYSQNKLIEIKKDFKATNQFDEEKEKNVSNDNLIYTNNGGSRKTVGKAEEIVLLANDTVNEEETNNMRKVGEKNSHYFQKKIKNVKTPKYKLFVFLTLCILCLLITCIIAFNYQTNLISIFDNNFNALYYNYYQSAQFTAINALMISIFFQITHISKQQDITDKQEVLRYLRNNLLDSRILFTNSFMNFQIELNEDFTKLYEPFVSHKITVNWEDKIFINDYSTKTALILADMEEICEQELNSLDAIDCENLLLQHYLTIDRKNTHVHGNFIRIIYYFIFNYETGLVKFFNNLEDSFYDSLDKFSKRTKTLNITLEIIISLFFILFFFINLYFLIQNNKYLFKNILYMFIDFTKDKNYDFNNKINNLLVEKKISNYITLLKEFTPKNLDILKYDKDIKFLVKENNETISIINNEEEKTKDETLDNKNKKIDLHEKTRRSKFALNKKSVNVPEKNNIFKIFSGNVSGKNNNLIKANIRALNNRDLNNSSNNNIINMNNSKNNSTNIILDSTNNSINNNSLISGSVKHVGSIKYKQKQLKNKEGENGNDITNYIDELDITQDDDDYVLTIDKIFHKTQISMLKSIKLIIIIFIIFTLIFIIYSIFKLLTIVLFIGKFNNVIKDFRILMLQYNEVIHYWNNIKTLFVLPNSSHSNYLEETENYFYQINSDVNSILNNRINNYKKVKYLYEFLSDPSRSLNESDIDFCLNQSRCLQIFYSNDLLTKDIESTVNLYAKEIENYYKDFIPNKDNIKSKEDIIKLFISDKYELLSLNINHVFIYIEQVFLRFFLEDEKDIINNFDFEVKVLNVFEICYCALLNLFSVLFVYTYINRIIASVEISSFRINESILRIRLKCF